MPRLKAKRPQLKTELAPSWSFSAGDYALDMAVHPGGGLLVVATGGGEVVGVDVAAGTERWRAGGLGGGVGAMALSPSGGTLAVGGHDGKARLLSVEDGRVQKELPVGKGWVQCMAWSPDGSLLATAVGKAVRLWTAAGEPFVETEPHASTVAALAWSAATGQLASCCYGGVHVWSVAQGARGEQLQWKGSLLSMAWSPDGKVIACGTQECSVHFWRLSAGTDSQMTGYPAKPLALAWDSESSLLATSGDAVVCVWDFRGRGPEGREPVLLDEHRGLCSAVAFAPRKALLATGAEDTGVILWEPRRGTKPLCFAWLEDTVTRLCWLPSGQALVGADAAGTVRLWPVP